MEIETTQKTEYETKITELSAQMHKTVMELVDTISEKYGVVEDAENAERGKYGVMKFVLCAYHMGAMSFDDPLCYGHQADVACNMMNYNPDVEVAIAYDTYRPGEEIAEEEGEGV